MDFRIIFLNIQIYEIFLVGVCVCLTSRLISLWLKNILGMISTLLLLRFALWAKANFEVFISDPYVFEKNMYSAVWGYSVLSIMSSLISEFSILGYTYWYFREIDKNSLREMHGNPLQYSCLENSMDRGAWWAIVHGVTKESDTTELLKNNKN